MQFNRSKSLQQLDGEDWGKPTYDSHLVKECHRLRPVPLRDFTVEDLRITIGQQMGLKYLIPIALEKLHDDPFAKGDFYPGYGSLAVIMKYAPLATHTGSDADRRDDGLGDLPVLRHE